MFALPVVAAVTSSLLYVTFAPSDAALTQMEFSHSALMNKRSPKDLSANELAKQYERFGDEVRDEAKRQIQSIRAQLRRESAFVSQKSLEAVSPLVVGYRTGDNLPTRGATTQRVYRIIKKYAPRHQNPHGLAEAIVAEALSQQYDPLFVAAVIKSESAFNTLAKSHKGAQGLMQLMPATGRWLANEASIPRGSLTDTGHNLTLGIRYLKQLEEQYNGDRVFTLIAYNWGPGRVESATDGKRRVPPEVVTYAIRILNDYRRWQMGG